MSAAHELQLDNAPVRGRKLPQYLAVYVGVCAGFLQLVDVAIQRMAWPTATSRSR